MATVVQGRLCSECGESFESQYRQAKTCGKACSAARERKVSALRRDKWLEANKDQNDATLADYRKKNRASRAAAQKEYYAANREYYSRYNREYRERTLENTRAYQAGYYAENSEAFKVRARIRKGVVRSSERAFLVTTRDMKRILDSSGGKCTYCHVYLSGTVHFDHVMPLSRNGNHSVGNLVPACPACNLSKSSKTVMEWRVWKRRMALAA